VALEALTTQEFYESNFHIIPESTSEVSREQIQQQNQNALEKLKERFGANVRYELVDGVEFRMAPGSQRVPILYAMRGEEVSGPSMFRLPAGQAHQVYLIFSARTRKDEDMLFHMLMWKVGDEWKATGASVVGTKIGDMDFDDILSAAVAERQAGQELVSFALYQMAGSLGGPNYRVTPSLQRFQSGMRDLANTLGLPQKPIETIVTQKGRFEIASVSVTFHKEGPCLVLHRKVEKLDSEDELAHRQRLIAEQCLKKYPSLKKYFSALAVSTVSVTPADAGRGYRTAHLFAELEGAAQE
jgi:hypothetical protein